MDIDWFGIIRLSLVFFLGYIRSYWCDWRVVFRDVWSLWGNIRLGLIFSFVFLWDFWSYGMNIDRLSFILLIIRLFNRLSIVGSIR